MQRRSDAMRLALSPEASRLHLHNGHNDAARSPLSQRWSFCDYLYQRKLSLSIGQVKNSLPLSSGASASTTPSTSEGATTITTEGSTTSTSAATTGGSSGEFDGSVGFGARRFGDA